MLIYKLLLTKYFKKIIIKLFLKWEVFYIKFIEKLKDQVIFPEDLSESIVNGVMNGNSNHHDLFDREKDRLIVDCGLSWSRGNYIDSAVLEEFKLNEFSEISYRIYKSGPWSYVGFYDKVNKSLFILKPMDSINKGSFKDENENYDNPNLISKFSHINDHFFNSNDSEKYYQTSFFNDPELEEADVTNNIMDNNDFQSFLVIAYKLDVNKNVSSIKVYMPDSTTNTFKDIQDLTYLIPSNDISSLSKYDDIKEEDDSYYGIGISDKPTGDS